MERTNYLSLAISVLKNAMKVNAVHLFEVNFTENRMRLLASVSEFQDNEILVESPVAAGILSTIFDEKEVFILNGLTGRVWNLPYYRKRAKLSAFLALPFYIDSVCARVSYLICLEKIDGDFTMEDRTAASSLVSMLSDLLVFSSSRDAQIREVMRLRNAVKGALDIHKQLETGATLNSLHRWIDETVNPRAVISAIYNETSGEFTIAWATPESERHLIGRKFKAKEGLVGLAVRFNSVLPEKLSFREGMQPILGDGCPIEIRENEPLAIILMKYESSVVGAVVIIGNEPFTEDLIELLEVLIKAASSSIQLNSEFRSIALKAVTDELTGLYNRRSLLSRLKEMVNLSRRHEREITVVMADLDHFKSINDTYGHSTGDVVLKVVGEVIRMNLRGYDIPARYGGEEFCLILPETGIDGAMKLAERIRSHVSRLNIPIGSETVSITMSMGIAHYPTHGKTAEELLKSADIALYRAKNSGRNRVVVF